MVSGGNIIREMNAHDEFFYSQLTLDISSSLGYHDLMHVMRHGSRDILEWNVGNSASVGRSNQIHDIGSHYISARLNARKTRLGQMKMRRKLQADALSHK